MIEWFMRVDAPENRRPYGMIPVLLLAGVWVSVAASLVVTVANYYLGHTSAEQITVSHAALTVTTALLIGVTRYWLALRTVLLAATVGALLVVIPGLLFPPLWSEFAGAALEGILFAELLARAKKDYEEVFLG